MPNDPPYGLDFLFSTITNVHFASGIFMIYSGIAVDPGVGAQAGGRVDVSFPGQAGGTPGFQFFNGRAPLIGGPSFKRFTAADFAAKQRTDAGLGLTGVSSMSNINPAPGLTNLQQAMFFVANSPFQKQFQVKVYMLVTDNVGAENMFTEVHVWKKLFPAGSTFDIGAQPYQGSILPADAVDSFAVSSADGDGTATFNIDIEKGTVSH